MNVERNSVVRFHYTLRDESGSQIENSRGGSPMAVLVGHGGIIPGLEEALMGRAPGERFEVTITPEQGYGPRHDNLVQRVPKKYFRDPGRLKAGATATVGTKEGPRMVTVIKVGMSVVDVDLNHPMAGRTLAFEIEIVDVREASEEELAHRHVHGEGGHQH